MILPRRKRGADACLYALGQELIAPLADALAGAEHLIVVPHGPLHGVPFHALAGPRRHLPRRGRRHQLRPEC